MAATSKTELQTITEKEFSKLNALLDRLDPQNALLKDDDDTSIKDVVGHRAHWIDLFLDWYADGQAGKEVHFPAPGYKWSELKRYNADLRSRQTGLTWDQARTLLRDRHDALTAFLASHSNSDLYSGPMKGARNDWTPGRWAEAAGPSHYRSAAKYVRMRMRSFG